MEPEDGVVGITSESYGYALPAGRAGTITINAGSVTIGNSGEVSSDTTGSGSGGDVTINASSVALTNGDYISSSTSGPGNGGNVVVHATQALEIYGNPELFQTGGIFAGSNGYAEDSGDAGTITVDAGTLTVGALGRVSSTTYGAGQGGDVTVNVAGALEITGEASAISVSTYGGAEIAGDAGQVTVDAESVTITDRGRIESSTYGTGNGGDVLVHATQALEISR